MFSSFLPALTLAAALTAALIKGSSADHCNGQCEYGTFCKQFWDTFYRSYACRCKQGFALLSKRGSFYVCYDLCRWPWTQCGPNTRCYWSSRKGRHLCVCRHGPRDALNGECPPKKSTIVYVTFTSGTDSTITPTKKPTSVRHPPISQTDSTYINTDTSTMKDNTENPNHGTSLASVSRVPVPSTSLTSVSKTSIPSTILMSAAGKIDRNTGGRTSQLKTGLPVGIGGVVLLALAALAVILLKKRRKRNKGKEESAQRGSRTAIGSGEGSAYVNVIDIIPQKGGQAASNPTYPASTLLPDLLSSSAQCQSAGTVRSEDNKGGYEKVDLPPHPGMIRASLGQYSLAGPFSDKQMSAEPKTNELYSNHNIKKNKWNESTREKINTNETAMNDFVYNVLTRPNVNPSSPIARDIPDHYNTLSDVKADSTNESQLQIQSEETGTGNRARNKNAGRLNHTT